MTTLILARHGETDWNRDGRFQGHADPPLNELGRRQARELANLLAEERIDAVYSSDLLRAYETAQIVAARVGLEVVVDPSLRERDVGPWSGLTHDEIEERFPEQLQRWREGGLGPGESDDLLAERVVAAVQRIATAHPDGTVLIVAHGGALRMLRRASGDAGEAGLANAGLVRIAVREGSLSGLD